MGKLGPVFLAWSHLRYRRGGLLGPLLILVVCLTLLFTQVGLYQAARDLPAAHPPGAPVDEGPSPDGGQEPGKAPNPFARGFLIGAAGLFVLLLPLFRQLLAPEMADRARELAMLHTIGYSPRYLRSVVFAEVLLLVLLAFVPAALLLPAVDVLVRAWTGLPLAFTLAQLGWPLLLTVVLALLVAQLACAKLGTALREGVQAYVQDLFG